MRNVGRDLQCVIDDSTAGVSGSADVLGKATRGEHPIAPVASDLHASGTRDEAYGQAYVRKAERRRWGKTNNLLRVLLVPGTSSI